MDDERRCHPGDEQPEHRHSLGDWQRTLFPLAEIVPDGADSLVRVFVERPALRGIPKGWPDMPVIVVFQTNGQRTKTLLQKSRSNSGDSAARARNKSFRSRAGD